MKTSEKEFKAILKSRHTYLKAVQNTVKATSIQSLAKASGIARKQVAECLRELDPVLYAKLNRMLDVNLMSIDSDALDSIYVKDEDNTKINKVNFNKFLDLVKSGETNKSKIADELNVPRITVYSYIKKMVKDLK